MSIVLASPHSPVDNSVFVHIARSRSRPKFLLSPPPPPKHKRLQQQKQKLAQPPTPPHTQRGQRPLTLATTTTTPCSPLLESFLNILDTPSPPTSVNRRRDTAAVAFALNDLGYNIAIETFYTSRPSPQPTSTTTTTAPAPTTGAQNSTPAKPLVAKATTLFGMNILSRQQTNHSTKQSSSSSSSSSKAMPLHPRSTNQTSSSSGQLRPPMPDFSQQRRGSLPTSSSSHSHSQNHPRSSSSKSSQHIEKDFNRAQNKRYPLPLPYSSLVEMDQILGDTRSAQKVPTLAGNPFGRGATPVGPNGEVSVGRPYIGADGRMWRDREEELEYTSLLNATGNGYGYRRGSDDTVTSLDAVEDGERHGRRAWAKFSAPSSSSKQSATQYDRFHAAEHRLRMPHSATSSSDGEDEDGADEPWSPLVETHAAQHQFTSYAFPRSSKSSRSSTAPSPSAATAGRAMPLPVSINDFAVPVDRRGPAVPVHHVPRAKEDFFASAFAPAPAPVPSLSRERERERRERSSRPSTATAERESRMTARRSSVQGVGRNEIVVPLPSLKPSAVPSSSSASRRAVAPQPASTPAPAPSSSGKGFLGVFKKK